MAAGTRWDFRELEGAMISYDPRGVKIVLTAPRGEMSRYNGDPFGAFIAVFPEKVIPRPILRPEWFEPEDNADGSAKFLPYGLRKVEALLLKHFPREDVVACHPDNLGRFVGPKTKVVGITSMDPMGLAYVSVTYNSMIGVPGESVDAIEFRRVIENPALRRYDPTILLGGAGGGEGPPFGEGGGVWDRAPVPRGGGAHRPPRVQKARGG